MSVTAQGHRSDGTNDSLSKVFDPACTISGYRRSGKEARKRLKHCSIARPAMWSGSSQR